jgi:SAM-dependent methyltransferase
MTESVDEVAREHGLEDIRKQSFREVVGQIRSNLSDGQASLLDVGCAHGWFLDTARAHGLSAQGIEPSAEVASAATARGHDVLIGLFPNDLPDKSLFNVISFNDVFEHIPDATATLRHIHTHLADSGLLVLSIPTNKGFFYRLSKIFHSLGIKKPFERMWQKDFPSPHLYYFNADVLKSMTSRAGFTLTYEGSLPSLRIKGLWSRLRYDRSASLLFNVLTYGAIFLASPILSRVHPDIDLLIFRKVSAG